MENQLDTQASKDKEVLFSTDSREKILKGINLVADAVKATLGPRGRNVVIEQTKTVGLMQNSFGLMPRITKDGVSVAKEINVSDKFENLGVQIIKEIASRQNERAGDGTTTATVLAQAIAQGALREITENNYNPILLKREIDEACQEALDYITDRASIEVKDAEELRSIATISANGDEEVGSIVAQAVEAVTISGVISVEKAPTFDISLEVVEGMEFPAGYASHHFITDMDKGIVNYEDAFVFFYDNAINDIKDILPVIQDAHTKNRPIIIMCADMADDVLATLVLNKVRNGFKVAVLKVPEYIPFRSDFLEDLAAKTGGEIIGNNSGVSLGEVTEKHFGKCDRVRINQNLSEFIGGKPFDDVLHARIERVEAKLKTLNKEDREYPIYEGRLAKLTGGIAVIHVGGSSEIDIGERKDRIEDAINATKAAVGEGIVAGGGSTLLRASDYIHKNSKAGSKGLEVLTTAMTAPFKTILLNAGIEEKDLATYSLSVLSQMGEYYGFDANTNEYCNMIEKGIIDPAKVVKNALRDAVGVVGVLITTEVAIVNKEEK